MIPLYHHAMNRMISRQDMDMVLTTMLEKPDRTALLQEILDRFATIIATPALYGKACANAREAYTIACLTLRKRLEAKGQSLTRLLVSPLAPSFLADVLAKLDIAPVFYDIDPHSFDVLIDVDALEAADALLLTGEGAVVPESLPTGLPIIEDLSYSFGSVAYPLGRGDILIMREGNPLMRTDGAALVMSTTKAIATVIAQQIAEIGGDERSGLEARDQQLAVMYTQLGNYAKNYKRLFSVVSELYKALYRGGARPVGHWSQDQHSGPFLQVIFDNDAKEVRAFIKKKQIELGALAPDALGEMLSSETSTPGCDTIIQRGVSFPCYALLKASEQEELIRVLASLPGRGRA